MVTARLCIVEGVVQGVGFRYFTQQQAQKLCLSGYAKNLADGNVEVLIEGEQDAVTTMLAWLQTGPVTATVTGVSSQEVASSGYRTFMTR